MDATAKIKKCGECKNEFPKTTEYFFLRIIKQKLVDGSTVEYLSLKSICKKCHGTKANELRIQKRCNEMGCETKDYRENWKKQYSKTRTLNPEISHLHYSLRGGIRKKIRKGYKYTNHEQYKLDCRSNVSMCHRKYDYGDKKLLTTKDINNKRTQVMSDSYLALAIGLSVNEIPKEMIETKRLIYTLKRELRNNNFKIR